jgi:hypothetical protein
MLVMDSGDVVDYDYLIITTGQGWFSKKLKVPRRMMDTLIQFVLKKLLLRRFGAPPGAPFCYSITYNKQ